MDELLKDVLGDLKAGRIDEVEALARVKRVVNALRPVQPAGLGMVPPFPPPWANVQIGGGLTPPQLDQRPILRKQEI